jgi:hypothetical protein
VPNCILALKDYFLQLDREAFRQEYQIQLKRGLYLLFGGFTGDATSQSLLKQVSKTSIGIK